MRFGSAVSDAVDAPAEVAGILDRSAGVGAAIVARVATTSSAAGWSPEAFVGATPGATAEGDAGLGGAPCATSAVADDAGEALGGAAFKLATRSRAAACTTCGGGGGERLTSGRRGVTSLLLSDALMGPAGSCACTVTISGAAGWSPEASVDATLGATGEGDAGSGRAPCATSAVADDAGKALGGAAFKLTTPSRASACTTCGGGGGENVMSGRRGKASLMLSDALRGPVGPCPCAVTISGAAG